MKKTSYIKYILEIEKTLNIKQRKYNFLVLKGFTILGNKKYDKSR